MKVRIGLAVGVALALALPVAAQAAFPKTSDTLIVPAKSIGGAKLDSSLAAATGAWGKGGTCTASGCAYAAKSSLGSASFILASTTVGGAEHTVAITLSTGYTTTGGRVKYTFDSPLNRFKTANGIGLGSTVKELKHAYSAAKDETAGVYKLAGAGTSFTLFTVYAGRVSTIEIESQHLG
jgi:hypothetical protein